MISIISPNYNKGRYLRQTISSVQMQSMPNWELIVIDDGSNDDSVAILEDAASKDSRIVLKQTSQEVRGANVARNIGISCSRFPLIMFLDSDDLLASFCLKQRLSIMNTANIDFAVFSGGTFLDKIGDRSTEWRPKTNARALEGFLSHELPWNISLPIWRKEFLQQVGGFSQSLSRLQDIDLHCRALLKKPRFTICNEMPVDFFYRVSEERKTFNSYDLCKRYVDSCEVFCESMIDQINQTAESERIRRRLLYALRGTPLAIIERISRAVSSSEITIEQSKQMLNQLLNAPYMSQLFSPKSKLILSIHLIAVRMRAWKIRGFTRLSRKIMTHL